MIPTRGRLPVAALFAILAFLHAVQWGSIVPLWQVPDEAAHFEYVHLLTRLGRRPTLEDADPKLQARMLRSMWENRYWEHLGLRRPDEPPRRVLPGGWTSGGAIPDTMVVGDAYVGAFSQLQNPTPVYYALLAPIQAAVLSQPIDEQLRALRWASRVIFALGVLFIVLAVGEVFAWRAVPVLTAGAFVALHPMFNYIGSGVNNDNGVMLFASATLWQLARGWRRGYPWWRLVLIVGLVAVAVQSKRTAAFLVLWAPLVLAAWWVRRQAPAVQRKVLIGTAATSTGAVALALVLYLIPSPTPTNWRSASPGFAGWQTREPFAGARTFQVQDGVGGTPWLRTSLRRPIGAGDGSPIVLTAYHRGSAAALALSDDAGNVATATFLANSAWQPVQVSMTLDPRATRLFIWLRAQSSEPALFDALAMTLATDPPQPLPLPNPSAEEALPVLGQVILSIAEPLGAYGQAARFIQDYRANFAALGERLPLAIAFVQQSFWGKFGIFARAPNPTLHMGWVTLLALGFGIALALALQGIADRRPDPDGAALLVLSLVGLGLLLAQTFAPLLSFAADRTWLPQGRYVFVGMGLIALVFSSNSRAGVVQGVVTVGVMAALAAGLFAQAAAFFK